MGRLAVDLKYQGQRLGEILLMDGLELSPGNRMFIPMGTIKEMVDAPAVDQAEAE
jgi:hypothetical protein